MVPWSPPAFATGHIVAGCRLGLQIVSCSLRGISDSRTSGTERELRLSLMGLNDVVHLDEALEHRSAGGNGNRQPVVAGSQRAWLVVAASCLVFLLSIASPPRLMDDVDAVQAQIARNMLVSGDWVTARLDGVPYLEKAPLFYWLIALSYRTFGVHDWAARVPLAIAAVTLCWVTYRFAR